MDKVEKQKTRGKKRSKLWPRFRRDYAKKQPKICSLCGGKKRVQLHHILPFHKYPELELDENNVIWLCEGKARNCHFNMGHLNSFKSWNVNIKYDAVYWLAKVKDRPYKLTKKNGKKEKRK